MSKSEAEINAEYVWGLAMPQAITGIKLDEKTIKILNVYRRHKIPFQVALEIILELFALEEDFKEEGT